MVKARAYVLANKEGKSSIGKGKGLCPSLHQKSSLGEEGKSSTEEGKDLCPSPEEGKSSTEDGKDLCPSLFQKSSWFGSRGTSITSAIVSVAMNWLNRSEKVFGEPGPNDKQHPRAGQQAKDYAEGSYETAIQRGIYTTMQWPKGLAYAASPYARLLVEVVAHIVGEICEWWHASCADATIELAGPSGPVRSSHRSLESATGHRRPPPGP